MRLAIQPYTDPNVFDTLAEAWGRLLRRSAGDTPFLTPDYQRTWWRHLGAGDLFVLALWEENTLVGIAPLFLSPGEERALRIVGCVEVSDYLDLIALPGREEDVIVTVLDFLQSADAPPWDVLDLCTVPAASPTLQILPEEAQRRGWECQVSLHDVCPVVLLPETWEDYLASLDRKDRHELRRKLRRAEALEGLRWYIVGPEHDLETEAEDFLTLMAKSSRAKEAFLTPPMRAFFRELIRVASDGGWLQLAFLQWEETKLSAYLNFVYNNRVLVYNSGLDWRADPGLGAGIVLTAYLIRHAIAEGREAYDFLRGSEDYKYRFGGKDVPVYQILVRR
ncbi:MAG: GNAT family N-acetyltransferase [Anaerolineae bacterium]|nr:GNAT family N-acetyltransferase [Anaerolineae bacterium]MDW7992022.1 GNAT family N-acetyltransferase [Anaerolineae bacterium]MDW8103312.1 GNAT family N-acetyltransferase [Anaerolineae bacterium]